MSGRHRADLWKRRSFLTEKGKILAVFEFERRILTPLFLMCLKMGWYCLLPLRRAKAHAMPLFVCTKAKCRFEQIKYVKLVRKNSFSLIRLRSAGF